MLEHPFLNGTAGRRKEEPREMFAGVTLNRKRTTERKSTM